MEKHGVDVSLLSSRSRPSEITANYVRVPPPPPPPWYELCLLWCLGLFLAGPLQLARPEGPYEKGEFFSQRFNFQNTEKKFEMYQKVFGGICERFHRRIVGNAFT